MPAPPPAPAPRPEPIYFPGEKVTVYEYDDNYSVPSRKVCYIGKTLN